MAQANPIDVEKFLEKSRFPSSKNELVQFVRNRHAPEPIVNAVEKIPDRRYNDAAEAARETFIPEDELPRGLDSCDD